METYLNSRRVVFIALLLLIVSLLYSSTFYAPFNFDDEVVIKLETMKKGGCDRSKHLGTHCRENLFPPRYRHLFYSSLLFNYSQGQLNPFGYHLVNTSIHIFTSIIIFFIALITLEKGISLEKKEAFSIASLTALLFSINPVNSEVVNYISARAVGMSSFFYLAALLSFIHGNFRKQKPTPRFLLYLLSLVCFLASILSKETALTFPLALLLYDVCFMRKEYWISLKYRLLFFYLPLFLCSAFTVLKVISMKSMIVDWWQRIDFEYGLKQIQIIGHGARLILLPIGLTFDYDFPNNFFNTYILLATTTLLILGVIYTIALYYPKSLTIISFCAVWFLITLATTNSILPRADLLSERNLYLPSFGILFLLAITIHRLVLANHNQRVVKKIGAYCLIIFFILQIILLHERNMLYRSNILLWEDTLKKAPGKLRALHNLSHFYMVEKNYAKAFTTLHALSKSQASPYYISYAHSNLGSIYLQLGDYTKAENQFKSGIKVKPSQPTNHFNLGTLLASQGRNLEAKESYEKAENLYKDYQWGYQVPAEFYMNKARLLLKLKLYKEAETAIKNYHNLVHKEEAVRIQKDLNAEIEIIRRETAKRMRSILSGKVVKKSILLMVNPSRFSSKIGRRDFKKSEVLGDDLLEALSVKDMVQIPVKDVDLSELQGLEESSGKLISALRVAMKDKIARLQKSELGFFIQANIYSATGRLEQALHSYNKVENTPKLKAKAHNNRALIYIKKKSFKLALEELNEAIMISPNLIDAHYNLGNLLMQTNGNSADARQHLEKALTLTTSQEGIDRIKATLKDLH